MANQWLRLWHDMPTDPKWRTIAKASGQRIGDVMAVYLHILVCASNATERGRTQSFNCEDVASALDIEPEQVSAIHAAMQSRVLDGDLVMGWEKRQVAREDGAAERAKAWRQAEKERKKTDANAAERNRTQTERDQTPDKDTEKRREETKKPPLPPKGVEYEPDGFRSFWEAFPKCNRKGARDKCLAVWREKRLEGASGSIVAHVVAMAATKDWTKEERQYVPAPVVYLRSTAWTGAEVEPQNAFEGGI